MPSRVGGGALPLRIMPLEAAAADPASLARLLERHRSAWLACSCFVPQVCLGVLHAAASSQTPAGVALHCLRPLLKWPSIVSDPC